MAIIIFDQTKCSLCNEVIKENDSIYSFAPFIQNTKDLLFQFSDETLHKKCIEKNELAKKAVQFSESFFNKIKPENRICIVGGNIIKNSEDYIFIDVLTSNSSEKIFKYNLLTLDKKNLANWKDRTDFINSVIQFQDEAKWGDLTSFKYLNHLVDRIKVLT